MPKNQPSDEYTNIAGYVICHNCGASAWKCAEKVQHFKNCKSGESKYWENHYNTNDEHQ